MISKHTWLAVIAGGRGTRLFPISHEGCPKQFCDLDKSRKFIQATIERFKNLGVNPNQVAVFVTNDTQEELAREQVRGLGVLGQNIYQVDESWGYPGVMIKANEIIARQDPEALVINTPSDQFVVENAEFKQAIEKSLELAEKDKIAVVGVKITDLVTAMGCGHVVYDPTLATKNGFHEMISFIEKPEQEIADKLMRSGSSAVNTGINVWKAATLLDTITTDAIMIRRIEAERREEHYELTTDKFLKELRDVYALAGRFEWHDCGTLAAMYDISKPHRTPNHKNASIGGGMVDRTDCLKSLFYAAEGFRLHATGFRKAAVITNVVEVNGEIHPIVCIVKLAESQRVKELAENIRTAKNILSVDFAIKARNNQIMRSNVSDDTIYGFVGVDDCIVNIYKNSDGTFDVYASQQHSCPENCGGCSK